MSSSCFSKAQFLSTQHINLLFNILVFEESPVFKFVAGCGRNCTLPIALPCYLYLQLGCGSNPGLAPWAPHHRRWASGEALLAVGATVAPGACGNSSTVQCVLMAMRSTRWGSPPSVVAPTITDGSRFRGIIWAIV